MKKRVCILILILAILGAQAGCVWNRKTVTVGGQKVVLDNSIPESTLDPADFTRKEDGSIVYNGGKYLRGIDVSAHQGKIDWKKVAEKADFAMIRVGYRGYTKGTLAQDTAFTANITQALKNRLRVGVYFFSQALNPKEAAAEARFVLKLIKKYNVTLNIAYDWEHIDHVEPGTARTEQVGEEVVTECAAAFCDVISKAGYTPAIYCNGMLGYLSYDLSKLPNIDVWYANYEGDSPDYAYQIRMWQYTDSGTISGVKGKVDYNLYFFDKEPSKEEKSA